MTFSGASVLSHAGDELGNFLPHLVGAIALLLIGIVIVRLLARALTKALQAVGLDEKADRAGVNRVLERAGLGSSLALVIGRAIRIALEIVVVFAALSLLGLAFLSDSLNKEIQELPKLLIAVALLLAGVVLAAYARDRGDRRLHHRIAVTGWDFARWRNRDNRARLGLGARDVARALSAG
jgi:p-aminobenzoyl-glutamate transporter AbgT